MNYLCMWQKDGILLDASLRIVQAASAGEAAQFFADISKAERRDCIVTVSELGPLERHVVRVTCRTCGALLKGDA